MSPELYGEKVDWKFFLETMYRRFIRKIKFLPWTLKLLAINVIVGFLNWSHPYCRKCMNVAGYWTKCKPYSGSPHSSGPIFGGWVNKKHCYIKEKRRN